MKTFLLVAFILDILAPGILKSQDHKFGHIDIVSVMTQLPEYKKSSDSLQKIGNDYAKTEKQLQAEFQQKYSDLIKNQDRLDTVIRQSRYAELQTMQANLEQFRQMANERLQKIEADLINSITMKVTQIVKIIAEEMELTYVFNVSPGNTNIIYTSEKSVDLMPMVKERMKL